MNKSSNILEKYIQHGQVSIFSKSWCPYCVKAKDTLNKLGVSYKLLELDQNPLSSEDENKLNTLAKIKTVPKIFFGVNCIGGNSELQKLVSSGEVKSYLEDAGIEI